MSDRVEGWKQISAALSKAAGIPVSMEQARRYAREHGLPVRRTGPGARKRVVATIDAIAAWCTMEFGETYESGRR